jgi:hypothetical protein
MFSTKADRRPKMILWIGTEWNDHGSGLVNGRVVFGGHVIDLFLPLYPEELLP